NARLSRSSPPVSVCWEDARKRPLRPEPPALCRAAPTSRRFRPPWKKLTRWGRRFPPRTSHFYLGPCFSCPRLHLHATLVRGKERIENGYFLCMPRTKT